ncbi:MAG TPA: PadR family transcriptional regulator [Chloroflexota bacterium]|nr:PadR family transcriptional regulator [Chloroflexota bacterium]
MFGRGWQRRYDRHDLRVPLLRLLAERPRRGPELAQALENERWGHRAANPAAVYPTLQLLEDLGYVAVTEADGKRLYTITDDGRRYLADHDRAAPERFDPAEWWTFACDGERRAVFRELGEFARLVGKEAGLGRHDAATLERVRATIAGARLEVEAILAGERSAAAARATPSATPPGGPSTSPPPSAL